MYIHIYFQHSLGIAWTFSLSLSALSLFHPLDIYLTLTIRKKNVNGLFSVWIDDGCGRDDRYEFVEKISVTKDNNVD